MRNEFIDPGPFLGKKSRDSLVLLRPGQVDLIMRRIDIAADD